MKNTSASNTTETEQFPKQPVFEIKVVAEYLVEKSKPDENCFVFAYTVTIENKSSITAQLLRRHWIITDAHGETMEVRGKGVVGEQPWISPGEVYEYTSGTVLNEVMGCMHGSFTMCGEDGVEFNAPIPVFTLAQPDKLH